MLLKVKETEQKLLKMKIEEPRIGSSSEVNIADFGASTDKNICNLAMFEQALAYYHENHIGRLTIPKGTYYFHSRPDNGSHLALEGLTDFILDGNGDISHIRFTHCHIGLRPGTVRSVSTAVDCLHVANSKGCFIVENCDFGYAGDDCINIHDNTSMGAVRIDEHTLLALRVRRRSVLFEKGNTVELRKPDLSPTGFCSTLTGVDYHDHDSTCTLTFQNTLAERLNENTVLFNNRFRTENFIIRNNRFTNNRARGILIQGSNGIVENNLFENIQGAAIQIEAGCETRWSEGKGVHNLIIRNNMIRHCDLNAWQMAVVYMGVYLPEGRTAYPIFENILIEHNTIIDCPRLAMFLSSCKNILVRHNVIINSNQISLDRNCYGSSQQESPIYGEKYQGTIQIIQASDVRFLDNFIFSTTSQIEDGIYADQASTNNIEKE